MRGLLSCAVVWESVLPRHGHDFMSLSLEHNAVEPGAVPAAWTSLGICCLQEPKLRNDLESDISARPGPYTALTSRQNNSTHRAGATPM